MTLRSRMFVRRSRQARDRVTSLPPQARSSSELWPPPWLPIAPVHFLENCAGRCRHCTQLEDCPSTHDR